MKALAKKDVRTATIKMSVMLSEYKIKPCPFCGENINYNDPANFRETDGSKWGAVVCGCGAIGPDVRTGYQEYQAWRDNAIKAWNERTTYAE